MTHHSNSRIRPGNPGPPVVMPRDSARSAAARARRRSLLILGCSLLLCAGCRPRTSTLTSQPAGAAVWLDGRPAGKTPLHIRLPKDRPLRVRVTHPGFRPWQKTLTPGAIAPGRTLCAVLSRRQSHVLEIRSRPEGALVLLDGEPRGHTPLTLKDLERESCRLTFRLDGFAPLERGVDLAAAGTETVRVSVRLVDLREKYYLDQIRKTPDDLMLYADLAHEYAIEHRFQDAADIIARGVKQAARHPELRRGDPARRLLSECDRILTRQFEYGNDADARKARACIAPMLKRLIDKYPEASPVLYVEYAMCRKLQGHPDEARKIMARAYAAFPRQRRLLQRFERRLRAARVFP